MSVYYLYVHVPTLAHPVLYLGGGYLVNFPEKFPSPLKKGTLCKFWKGLVQKSGLQSGTERQTDRDNNIGLLHCMYT